MDRKLEKKLAGQILKRLDGKLQDMGFKRTKPAFYTRAGSDRIEFVHTDKLASGPYFRVHVGIRFLCDSFPVVALNGIHSDAYREYRIRLGYTREEETLDRCAEAMLEFVRNEGEPWLARWADRGRLLSGEESPIAGFKDAYLKFLEQDDSRSDAASAQSRRLLGIEVAQ